MFCKLHVKFLFAATITRALVADDVMLFCADCVTIVDWIVARDVQMKMSNNQRANQYLTEYFHRFSVYS